MNEIHEIVIVALHMGLGGAERVFSELTEQWIKMGLKVTIVMTRPNKDQEDYRITPEAKIIRLRFPKGKFRRIRQLINLVNILKKEKKAVVISFLESPILLTGMASLFIKNKIIFTERNDPDRNPSQKLLNKGRDLLFELADICIFQTQQAKAHFSRRIQSRGYIIHNPINPYLPEPYIGIKRKTIISAARLDRQKNLPMLINAFELFHKKHGDYTLEIYGKGPLHNELEEMIKAKGLSDSAKLCGFSNNIYEKMKDCSVYVSSSDYEGISNSMLEALGLGIPTICTDCPIGGARETISDGINGLLVQVGDTDALYRAMCRIVEDEEFAGILSKNAIKIRQELSVDKIAKQWLDVMKIDL